MIRTGRLLKKGVEFFAQHRFLFCLGVGDLFSILLGGRVFILYFVWRAGGGSERKGHDTAMML